MEFRQLRYFVAVAQHLNFSRAAQSVHITQSTISHQIKQLETHLGYTLFQRNFHQVRLTREGEILLPRVVHILKDLDDAVQLARAPQAPFQERVRVVSGAHTMATSELPALLPRFNAQCPHVSVDIEEVISSAVLQAFGEGDADLAFGDEETSAPFPYDPLFSEELILVAAPGTPLAKRRRLRMVELHGEPLALPNNSFAYRKKIDRCLAAAGARPNVVAEFNHPSNLLHAVAEQGMAGIVTHNYPKWFREFGLIHIHLEDPTPFRNIVVYRRNGALTPAVQALSATVCEHVRATSRRPNDLGMRPFGSGGSDG
jgi:LysR family cyn operon transcriptional activator